MQYLIQTKNITKEELPQWENKQLMSLKADTVTPKICQSYQMQVYFCIFN